MVYIGKGRMYSDGSPKPRFKRYYTGNKNKNGKGDDQRPSQVDEQTLAQNWCRTFGHKRMDTATMICRDCGMTAEEIEAEQDLK